MTMSKSIQLMFFVCFVYVFSSNLSLSFHRISVIFRIRSAKTVIITDASLLKRLALLCGFVGVALLVRTLVAPPVVIVGRTADNLKAFLCKTDYWDHTFTSSKLKKMFGLGIIWFFFLIFPHFFFFFQYSGSIISCLGRTTLYNGTKSTFWIQWKSFHLNGDL